MQRKLIQPNHLKKVFAPVGLGNNAGKKKLNATIKFLPTIPVDLQILGIGRNDISALTSFRLHLTVKTHLAELDQSTWPVSMLLLLTRFEDVPTQFTNGTKYLECQVELFSCLR